MATDAFFQDLETAVQLLLKVRDHQRTFDTLFSDGDLTAVQRAALETRANRHVVAARTVITNLDRAATTPQTVA